MSKQYSILTMGQTYRVIESEDGIQWRPRRIHGYEMGTFETLQAADKEVNRLRKREVPARRMAVNEELHRIGQTYWASKSQIIYVVNDALELNGFSIQSVETLHNLNHSHTEVGDGFWLTLNIHRMDSGNWEVVAYVS